MVENQQACHANFVFGVRSKSPELKSSMPKSPKSKSPKLLNKFIGLRNWIIELKAEVIQANGYMSKSPKLKSPKS